MTPRSFRIRPILVLLCLCSSDAVFAAAAPSEAAKSPASLERVVEQGRGLSKDFARLQEKIDAITLIARRLQDPAYAAKVEAFAKRGDNAGLAAFLNKDLNMPSIEITVENLGHGSLLGWIKARAKQAKKYIEDHCHADIHLEAGNSSISASCK